MLKIYGSEMCPRCIACKKAFDEKGISYEFIDINETLANLKALLKYRDSSDLFDEPKAEGRIGIPCIICEDGSITLNWQEIAGIQK